MKYTIYRKYDKCAEEFPTNIIGAIINSLVLRWFYDYMEVSKRVGY